MVVVRLSPEEPMPVRAPADPPGARVAATSAIKKHHSASWAALAK
jgi:hypothetical protein